MLNKLKLTPFSANELKPTGWLRRQLELQAAGLSGNLDLIWPDIRDSRWIGGNMEGWERVPYWLDGFVPLAFLLEDEDLKARAKRYIDGILGGQQEDGWICPCSLEERAKYDVWALFLICKVLALYADCSGDPRCEEAIYRALQQFSRHVEHDTLFNWGAARWYECLIPLFWLYERRQEKWMLDLAHTLSAQGIDYGKVFQHWRYEKPQEMGRWNYMTHVVNLAMCLKEEALFSRLTGEDGNTAAKNALSLLLRDHGMAVHHFSGDECLSGTSPIQGSECCSVVEAMYSYEVLLSVTGDASWSDHLENAAFNALPATLSPDMWTHQYDQMTNQVECSRIPAEVKPFRTNSGESHLFGLEPNFGCCTANFNQGWPKFALSTWMRAEDGLVQTAVAPSSLSTQMEDVPVSVTVTTGYPFEDGGTISVTTDSPVTFTLRVRVPACVKTAIVDGKEAAPGWAEIRRTWSGTTEIPFAYTMETRMEARPSGMHTLWRGPLLFAVSPKERWEKLEFVRNGVERKAPWCDYEIFAESPWNYGFTGTDFQVGFGAISAQPFDPACPPIWVEASLAQIDWQMENGTCTLLPASKTPIAPPERVRMIPYGCTNLRMTEMPIL